MRNQQENTHHHGQYRKWKRYIQGSDCDTLHLIMISVVVKGALANAQMLVNIETILAARTLIR